MTQKKDIKFEKYETRGVDYHHRQINKLRFFEFNAYVHARYLKSRDILEKYLNKSFKKDKKIRLLDVGCGDGVLLYLISKKLKDYNLELYGVDLSSKAIHVAHKKMPHAKFVVGDVCNLKFKCNFFDVVVSSDVIEHVKQPKKMLKEIHRVSKNGALVVIGTPIRCAELPIDKMHYKEFYTGEFREIIGNYFKILELVESHPLFNILRYNKLITLFGINVNLYRYATNILAWIGLNPFMKERKNKRRDSYSYMFCVGVK